MTIDANEPAGQHGANPATERLAIEPDELGEAVLIDVRRAAAFEQSGQMLLGAHWRDPAQVASWAGELAKSLPDKQRVVVYCVHGHEVSQLTAQRLHELGIDARFLRGGFEAWRTAGRPLIDKPEG